MGVTTTLTAWLFDIQVYYVLRGHFTSNQTPGQARDVVKIRLYPKMRKGHDEHEEVTGYTITGDVNGTISGLRPSTKHPNTTIGKLSATRILVCVSILCVLLQDFISRILMLITAPMSPFQVNTSDEPASVPGDAVHNGGGATVAAPMHIDEDEDNVQDHDKPRKTSKRGRRRGRKIIDFIFGVPLSNYMRRSIRQSTKQEYSENTMLAYSRVACNAILAVCKAKNINDPSYKDLIEELKKPLE